MEIKKRQLESGMTDESEKVGAERKNQAADAECRAPNGSPRCLIGKKKTKQAKPKNNNINGILGSSFPRRRQRNCQTLSVVFFDIGHLGHPRAGAADG